MYTIYQQLPLQKGDDYSNWAFVKDIGKVKKKTWTTLSTPAQKQNELARIMLILVYLASLYYLQVTMIENF